ncbi:MAG: peptidyl-prolyl cis-trans isomerase, partial [Candidatus Hydrogenedentales bacterium]
MSFTQEYLIDKMKQDPYFQSEAGGFDSRLWNQFVQANQNMDWNAFYESQQDLVARNIFLDVMAAGARVPESELRKQFERQNTKIRVKYAAVQPPIEPTEEELRAFFEQDRTRFTAPEERQAEFISLSLEPERPDALLDEIAVKAHEGATFEEIAQSYADGPTQVVTRDMAWVTETAQLPEHQQVLFGMEVGALSDPIEGPTGIHIYSVIEDRVSQLAGKRDVHAEELIIRPQLAPEEKEQRLARARELAAGAKEAGALGEAAAQAGAEVKQSDFFDAASAEIENVDPADVIAFRQTLSRLEAGAVSEVVEGRKNAYIARILDYRAPREREFEEAREDIEVAYEAAQKQSPEYQAEAALMAQEIAEKATKLADIQSLFPEAKVTIEETAEPFGPNEFLFQQGIMWQPQQAHALLSDAQPGEIAGPMRDFTGETFFIELVERIEPDETMWAEQWPAEKELLHEQFLQMRQMERQADYMQHLREQAEGNALIQTDFEAVAQLIGLNDESESIETPTVDPLLEAIPEPAVDGPDMDLPEDLEKWDEDDAGMLDLGPDSGEGGTLVPESLPGEETVPQAEEPVLPQR